MNDLEPGSIMRNTTTGTLYKKGNHGIWYSLVVDEAILAFSTNVMEVLWAEEKGPLDDFVEGDIISFASDYGRRIALKHRDDFWSIIGMVGEKTSEELLEYFAVVPDSVRKVGSLDGGS